VASAGLIQYDDWHDNSGDGGLRQSFFHDTVYFAVSKDIAYSNVDTYVAAAGFHIATVAEYDALWNSAPSAGNHLYYNQGDWIGYSHNGHTGHYFAFGDKQANGSARAAHAGNFEYHASTFGYDWNSSYGTYLTANTQLFGGMIMIKDATDVPEPSTLAIFALGIIGLASRRFKKQS